MKKLLSTLRSALCASAFGLAFALGAGTAGVAHAAAEGVALDHFPAGKVGDLPALQRGAKLFVNYCLNCHSASAVRYSKLQDLGLSEDQIEQFLLFGGENAKVGDLMTVAAKASDQKAWFGVAPPDLSLTAKSRSTAAAPGVDWIYTYLRTFYRDNQTPTGWNNLVYANAAMPHVMWDMQGLRTLTKEETKKVPDPKTKEEVWARVTTTWDEYGIRTENVAPLPPGTYHEGVGRVEWKALDPQRARDYDDQIGDLVAFMAWMADPTAASRFRLGVIVLIFLGLFTVLAWGLNRSYWKDIK